MREKSMTKINGDESLKTDTLISPVKEVNNEDNCNDFFTTISAQRYHYMKEVARIQNNKNMKICDIEDKP